MSAGFKVGDEVFWGTNGLIEAYLDEIVALAEARIGSDMALARFFRCEYESFFTGKVVLLDEWTIDPGNRRILVMLFEDATKRLLREGVLSDQGAERALSILSGLRAALEMDDCTGKQ